MKPSFTTTELYKELESSLPTSTGEKRKPWVAAIIENDIPIKDLTKLLTCEKKTALRFLWLLSEVGLAQPAKLHKELPYLFGLFNQLSPAYQTSFASYWLIANVPTENEAEAIHILFQWLLSARVNVTIKARSALVLFSLTKKYPELKNELSFCLKDQMDKYTKDFKKRMSKLLAQLQD